MSQVAKMVVMLLCAVMLLSACATGTRFVLPEGTKVYIPTKDSAFSPGRARTRPFFWDSAGGIDYQLLKEGKVIKQGELTSNFRLWSFFWPPLAILYWPIGFKPCYDLTGPEAMLCGF
jgi:hypothetical protein